MNNDITRYLSGLGSGYALGALLAAPHLLRENPDYDKAILMGLVGKGVGYFGATKGYDYLLGESLK